MQAIRVHTFGDPSVLKLETLPTPTPAKGQVLIRIHAAGINPVDTYIRSGKYASLPPLPYTPGTDAAGTIEALGEAVSNFQQGQRVYTCRSLSGTYASHCLADAATQVRPLPDNISFEQGAGVFVPYYTSFHAAFDRGQIQPGEIVLIHGATGGVGLAAVQHLRNLNVTLVATGGSQPGRDLLKTQGVNHVFDHSATNYLDAIKSAFPRGIDAILEMASEKNLPNDLTLLAPAGRVIVIGNRAETTINPRLLMGKGTDIRGISVNNATPAQMDRMHRAMTEGLSSNRLSPVIAHKLKLEDAPNSHDLIHKPGALGKIILLP